MYNAGVDGTAVKVVTEISGFKHVEQVFCGLHGSNPTLSRIRTFGLLMPLGKGIWSTGLTLLSRVADVIGSEGWRWKPRKTAMLSVIQEKVSHIIPGDREDRIIWSAHPKGILTVARTWDFIRDKMAEVEWHRLLWTSPLIPRHCFISWLAIRGRLSTLDRISRWKKDISSSCVLCGTEEEKRDHIFFSCPFSTDVWVKILLMNGENRSCRYWRRMRLLFLRPLECEGLQVSSLRTATVSRAPS
ncbi:hypothetical protein CRG98_004904 [Punica granatum]|uniref:Reverse transcriptase zinc-binding domain-containing protein n=1 Tax=Punica granatum TaxID=22663 RepID=A0A2I0L1K6_PUNGR|nr:hypothetical protein CRG98_004904 [Punica granatum]